MAVSSVITIGRQFGSGGRYAGRLLAEKLGIPFYDKELLTEASKQSGICRELFEDNDEKRTGSLLFSLVSGIQMTRDNSTLYTDLPLSQKIFLAQFETIRNIAAKGPCVIVGRCGDYVLRDDPRAVKFFVKADMDHRAGRAIRYYGVDEKKVEEVLKKADKQRAAYYNYYATTNWGDLNNYDLCVDSGAVGIEGSVEIMARFVELREQFRKG